MKIERILDAVETEEGKPVKGEPQEEGRMNWIFKYIIWINIMLENISRFNKSRWAVLILNLTVM
jgi:hypothetical protein